MDYLPEKVQVAFNTLYQLQGELYNLGQEAQKTIGQRLWEVKNTLTDYGTEEATKGKARVDELRKNLTDAVVVYQAGIDAKVKPLLDELEKRKADAAKRLQEEYDKASKAYAEAVSGITSRYTEATVISTEVKQEVDKAVEELKGTLERTYEEIRKIVVEYYNKQPADDGTEMAAAIPAN